MKYTLKKRLRRNAITVYHGLQIDKLFMCFGVFDKKIDSSIKKFGKTSHLSASELKNDIKKCYYKYLTTPDEYFLYSFEGKDDAYKRTFLPDNLKIRYLLKTVSEKKYVEELCDKYNFYCITKPYFKRAVILLGGANSASLTEFKDFVSKHKDLFAKPLSATWGIGAHVVKIDNSTDISSLYKKYLSAEWIIEERIQQCAETMQWNESSVNTVRLPCILSASGFHVLNPFLRTGRKGAVVDNAGGGGVFACIDEKSGKVCTNGIDELNNVYENHPDSGIQFIDWQVPHWDDLLKTAEEIFRTCLPEHKYIGFDFALTDNGWVLVEGNWGQFVGQYVSKIGVRDRFVEYLH